MTKLVDMEDVIKLFSDQKARDLQGWVTAVRDLPHYEVKIEVERSKRNPHCFLVSQFAFFYNEE